MEMEPPPSTTPPLPTAAQPPQPISPHFNSTDSRDAPSTTTTTSTKLRLMCSYGGHIIPRPHDKTLCYIGGDTRIIVIDRHTTLSDLQTRLSRTILNNKPFSLKYQLPNEDLDSLISISTDEDLENMIDEYDRILLTTSMSMFRSDSGNRSDSGSQSDTGSRKNWRIRLFLFDLKSEISSIESLLENSTRSEGWFLDALNGNVRESVSSVNCLLGLDDVVRKEDEDKLEKNIDSNSNGNGNGNLQDVHSVPDSPMLDTTSSFGSTSSMPSLGNLPPIRVHVEESGQKGGGGLGIEEQFQQMSVGGGSGVSPPAPMAVGQVVTGVPAVGVGGGEYGNRVVSDDERSEQSVGYRMVPQVQLQVQLQQQQQHQQQPIQLQQKPAGAVELPSPDSVSSEGSITNTFRQRQMAAYQEQIMQMQSGNNRALANPVDQNNRVQMQQQVQESEYVMPGQFDQHPQLHPQQQFVHASVQYMHPHGAGTMPIASYYPVYPPQQQHHPQHPGLEQQYVYYVPARQAQAYNMPVQQQSYSDSATSAPTSRPQTPPPATMVNPAAAYNPAMNVAASKPEMAAGVYRTSAAGAPQSVQVHSSQHQPQYVGYSQMHHPTQSVAPTPGATANFSYEYADPMHAQVYYTQRLTPQMAAQYQTMTSAPGVVRPGASPQVPAENIKQQNSISQP